MLEPAGVGAERIAALAWWLFAGATVIWLLVMGLALYGTRVHRPPHPVKAARLLILGGGVIVPTLVLGVVLGYGLWLMPSILEPAPPGGLSIQVSGERWWWRVRYGTAGGEDVELANEIHIPVDEPTELRLTSPDVIHSFWVPALAGKVDMIPGRETRLVLRPTRTGVFPGVCAEFCGLAHAHMGLRVVVSDRPGFDAWLARQAQPAARPADGLAERGLRVLLASGCGACHSVRGTPADGVIAPDLTHVGGRLTLGAAVIDNDREGLGRWLSHPRALKPGVEMPGFGVLGKDDLLALATYLDGLE